MKIIVLNQKGGVSKSVITVNCSYGLSKAGKKTLILDLDPQAHSSVVYSPELPKEKTMSELFKERNLNIKQFIRTAQIVRYRQANGQEQEEIQEIDNLYIIPSNIHLAASAEMIISRTHREKILHNQLKKIEKSFDYILIDCPPTLGILTVNAIYTADLILIPTNYGKYSLDGIADLFNSIADVKESETYNYLILRTQKKMAATRTNEVIEEQLKPFGDRLLKTVIRQNEAINQALMENLPVYLFDHRANGTEDFKSLTKEILAHGS